jgi:hypothetical protein
VHHIAPFSRIPASVLNRGCIMLSHADSPTSAVNAAPHHKIRRIFIVPHRAKSRAA